MQFTGGTNLAQSWDALQDSRQLSIGPTESSLWFQAKVDKNFACGDTESVAFSRLLYAHIHQVEFKGCQPGCHITAIYLQSFAVS